MKYLALTALALTLGGCYVAPPPAPVAYVAPAPVYAVPAPAYYAPGYYAYPAYPGGYYGPNVNLGFGYRGRRW